MKGKEEEEYELEWTFPYTDNYTGMYWSNGQLQTSVAYGDKKPKSRLDSYSRDHDTSYALCPDDECLDRADRLYYDRTRAMSAAPRFIGSLPITFNPFVRKVSRVFTGEKYTKMASQAIPGNLRGHTLNGEFRVNPTLNGVGFRVGAAKPKLRISTVDDSVCYDPSFNDKDKIPMATSEIPRSTPLPTSVKERPLDLTHFGGNDRGTNQLNSFMGRRGRRGGGFLRRWRKRNKNKMYVY